MQRLDLFTPPAVSAEGAWTVAEVTRRARQVIETGLDRVWVRGEVTGLKAYRSGHWYFTLRDAEAQVRCVMWHSDQGNLREPPAEGTEVYALSRPTVWEERGEFRLTVRRLIPTATDGLWHLQLERAKASLQRDGLLDPSRKRPLPAFPQRVVVVTSLDGAALSDILTVLERRWPAVQVLVVATRVQGDGAEDELCRALGLVNRLAGVDVAIVGRGGGSREDLWAFNTERVARAVAAIAVPTVSAVGHETDISLTDLVADVRAPTPSAAAEAVVPDRVQVRAMVDRLAGALARSLTARTELGRERLDRTGDRLTAAIQTRLDAARHRLERLAASLDALSPLRVLERGYAVARSEQGTVLRRVAQFTNGLPFSLTLADGTVRAHVASEGERS